MSSSRRLGLGGLGGKIERLVVLIQLPVRGENSKWAPGPR
jgi:hypothetical protein